MLLVRTTLTPVTTGQLWPQDAVGLRNNNVSELPDTSMA